MIELEKTYLVKKIPENLKNCKFKEIIDVYIPKTSEHPKLRLRKKGNSFELTKKEQINKEDASNQEEQTIVLNEEEFNALNNIDGKKVRKIRYFYEYEGKIAEFDIFQDLLSGLVVVEFEFATAEEKEDFKMPDFCLADITQEKFIAGGIICDKSYEDIEGELKRFGYEKISFHFNIG
jgi:CYTH domain-containing protein